MSGEFSEKELDADVENDGDEIESSADDDVMVDDMQPTDNVGDVSVEINVEELVAKIESEDSADVARKKEIRRRLEDMAEEKDFEDTYAIDLGDEN